MRIPGTLCAFVPAALALLLAAGAEAHGLRIENTLTIKVTSLTTEAKAHDLKPRGKPNKGDSIAFKDLLVNRQPQFGKAKGKNVAYDAGTLLYTSKTTTTMTVLATFPGIGTIRYGGPFVTRHGITVLPIKGGTGGFQGATGTVTIGSGATSAPNIYVVRLKHHLSLDATGVN